MCGVRVEGTGTTTATSHDIGCRREYRNNLLVLNAFFIRS